MSTAQNLKIIDATPGRARSLSISEWFASATEKTPFAYEFLDGSAAIYLPCGHILATSAAVVKRWCANGRIDRLIAE